MLNMDKLRLLRDAIAVDIQDGMSIAMGCGLESLIPFAASYEIIRQEKKNLTLIGPISDMQFDQLIGAGCVQKIVASWVGNVAAGLGHNYRRAAESGIPNPIEIEEHSNFTIGLGLQAAAMGFLSCRVKRSKEVILEKASSFLWSVVRSPTKSCWQFAPSVPMSLSYTFKEPTRRATPMRGEISASCARLRWQPRK